MKKLSSKPLSEYHNYRKFLSNEGQYEGQVLNLNLPFKKHGYGIMKYNDGSNYTGYWKENKK